MHCVKMHPLGIYNAWGEIHLHNYIGTAYNHTNSFWRLSAVKTEYCLLLGTFHRTSENQLVCPSVFPSAAGSKDYSKIHCATWNSPGPETLILREYCQWLIIEWNNLGSAVSDHPHSKHTLSSYQLCAFSTGR